MPGDDIVVTDRVGVGNFAGRRAGGWGQKSEGNGSTHRDISRPKISGQFSHLREGQLVRHAKFGLGRIKLRELAMRGEVPGVIKASW